MKYEVNVFLKDCLILSWCFKSISQVCKFLENADMSLLDFQIYRIGTLESLDPVQLMKIWRCDHA